MPEFHTEMLKMSEQVLRDSALENGAMIAANGIYLPPTATAYHYVWGRDAAKHLLAAYSLGMADAPAIRERFLKWIIRCIPGDDTSKLFIKRNQINGPNDFLYNDDRGFQPDNNGALLSAIDATRARPNDPLDDQVVRMLANGLSAKWDVMQQRFTMLQQDLWENDVIALGDNNFFTHALLVAAHGLGHAADSSNRLASKAEKDHWKKVSQQMYGLFTSVPETKQKDWYSKRLYVTADYPGQLDAGLALAIPALLPANAPAHVQRMAANTIRKIATELLQLPYGAKRYEGDIYDGIERIDGSQGIAGAWPLLGYAWVQAARKVGMDDEADAAQNAMDAHLQKLYKTGVIPKFRVPEQIHPDGDARNGLGPMHFAWGSAEWVLAHEKKKATR
jgi:GH15 family glucan-1,4-alpha-glucosidase